MPLELEFKVGTSPAIRVIYASDLYGGTNLIRVESEEINLLLSPVEAQMLLEALDKVLDYQPEIVPGRVRKGV
jgi:hypothetical protein